MILPGMLRRFIKVFRGDVSPALILLSAMLGVTFGMTPGFYGVHVALLVIALIININIGVFVLFAFFGKAFCFAAAPLLFQVGRGAQDHAPGLLSTLGSLPIAGVTDFSRYSVAGGVVLGPILGMFLGVLMMLSVVRFRKKWLELDTHSEKFRAWHSSGWVRFLERILVGKRADPSEVLKRRTKYIRTPGILAAIVLVVLAGFALRSIKDDVVTDYTARSMTGVNGAEVDLARVILDPLAGQFSIKELQATDPAKPAQNRVAFNDLSAKVGLLDLSRGRIIMDNISLSKVRFDEPRTRPGAVLPAFSAAPAEPFDINRFKVTEDDLAKLESYVNDAKGLREWMDKIQKWLPERRATSPPPPVPQSYLEYLSARAPLSPTPHVLVKQLSLEGVKIPIDHIGMTNIQCSNLSDAPSGAGLPVNIDFKSTEHPVSISFIGHYEKDGGSAEIKAEFADYDLQKLQARLNRGNPVQFQGGTASGSIDGRASRDSVDIAIHVRIKGMRVQTAGKGIFGLDPQVTAEALKVLENINTTIRLVGPLNELRIVFDGKSLTKEFRDALVRAGKAELAKRADALLAGRLPGGVPSVGKVIEDPLKTGQDFIGNLTSQPAKSGSSKKKP